MGKFDGIHPSLACATKTGKVILHSPHDGASAVRTLNINNKITCIASCSLIPDGTEKETLLIGTSTNLLAYDIEANSDVFHKDIPDAVSCVVPGKLEGKNVLAIVGELQCARI